MQKRILSLLLVACLLLPLIPVVAMPLAAVEPIPTVGTEPYVTSFAPGGENWPVITADGALYGNNWEIGGMKGNAAWNTGYYTASIVQNFGTIEERLAGHRANWMSQDKGAAGAQTTETGHPGLLVASIDYDKKGANNVDSTLKNGDASMLLNPLIRYTADRKGTVTITFNDLRFYADNSTKFAILHNGKRVGDFYPAGENFDYVKGDGWLVSYQAGTNVGAALGETTFAVEEGDTIDFVVRGNEAYQGGFEGFKYDNAKRGIFRYNIDITYEPGWEYIDWDALYAEETFNPSDLSVFSAANLKQVKPFYVWHKADGTVMKGDGATALTDDCYATVNPDLYAAGVLEEGMSFDELWDAYGTYLASQGKVNYGNGWAVKTLANGQQKTNDMYLYMVTESVYGVRVKSSGTPIVDEGWTGFYATSFDMVQPYVDEMVSLGKNSVQPDADGQLSFATVKTLVGQYGVDMVSDIKWTAGTGGITFVDSMPALRPSSSDMVALSYTVQKGVYGTANIDLNADTMRYCNGETDAYFCITLNDEVIWPADATDDKTSWYVMTSGTSFSTLAADIKAIDVKVKAGDELQFRVARGDTGSRKVTLDLRPTLEITKSCGIEYRDHNDKVVYFTVVDYGAALPACPLAYDGLYYINGSSEARELPETATSTLVLQMQNAPAVAEAQVARMELDMDGDMDLDLYITADENAIGVGVIPTMEGYYFNDLMGVEQTDGTYKVTLSGLAAKDLSQEISLFLYQIFDAGEAEMDYEFENEEEIMVRATDALQEYVKDDSKKAMAQAALDYAAAADAYFNGTTLAADVATRLAAVDGSIAALSQSMTNVDQGAYTITAATLILKNETAIKIKIRLTEFALLEDDVFDCMVKVTDSKGNETIIDNCFSYLVGEDIMGGAVSAVATLNGIEPGDFGDSFEITVCDEYGDPISNTIVYSVNTYIARTFDANAKEANLLRALYAFGAAA